MSLLILNQLRGKKQRDAPHQQLLTKQSVCTLSLPPILLQKYPIYLTDWNVFQLLQRPRKSERNRRNLPPCLDIFLIQVVMEAIFLFTSHTYGQNLQFSLQPTVEGLQSKGLCSLSVQQSCPSSHTWMCTHIPAFVFINQTLGMLLFLDNFLYQHHPFFIAYTPVFILPILGPCWLKRSHEPHNSPRVREVLTKEPLPLMLLR